MTRDLDLLKVDVKLMRQSSTGHDHRGEATGLHISPHQSGMTFLRSVIPLYLFV
jgi:hypothetical protein